MSLRRKTILLVVATIVVLGLAVLAASSHILTTSFRDLETEFMRRNAGRVQDALAAELAAMQTYATDWGNWDEAYHYLNDRNRAFVTANFGPNTLAGLRMNFLALYDTAGRPVQEYEYDLIHGRPLPIEAAIESLFRPGSPLLRYPDTAGLRGLAVPGGKPLLLAIRPILSTDQTGPSRGTLVMGRFLDSAEVALLAAQTHLSVALLAPDDPRARRLREGKPAAVKPLSRQSVAAYEPIRDLFGHKALVLEVSQARSIVERGRTAISWLVIAVLVVCLVLGSLTVLLLETLVLGRLSRLTRDVVELGQRQNGEARRVRAGGRDELATLANEINKSVAALDEANSALAEKNRELAEAGRQRRELLDIAMMHDFGTPMTVVQGYAELLRDGVLGPVPDKQKKAVEAIYSNLKSLDTLRSQMLEVSGFDRGDVALEMADARLYELVLTSVADLGVLLHARKLDVQVRMPDASVRCDPDRIRQVVRTYLAGMVKYADEGTRVLVAARPEGTHLHVVFSAETTTPVPGVSQDRFGSWGGLGMALASAIVTAHHGKAWIERIAGADSRLHFTLPLAQPANS
jgi:sensor domain CHASE-containing protein